MLPLELSHVLAAGRMCARSPTAMCNGSMGMGVGEARGRSMIAVAKVEVRQRNSEAGTYGIAKGIVGEAAKVMAVLSPPARLLGVEPV